MILIDKMTEEQKNRYREFLNFYSKDLTKIFGEMFSKKREDILEKDFYKSYLNIIKKTATFMKELGVTDPFRATVVFEYLLWNGFLSKDINLIYSISDRINNIAVTGADIMRGKSVCLNNADMLSDVLNEMGTESYVIGANVSIRNQKVNLEYRPDIERKIENKVKMKDMYFFSEPTGLAFLNFTDFLKAQYVGSDLEIDIKPWLMLALENVSFDKFHKIIGNTFVSSDKQILTIDNVRTISENALDLCHQNYFLLRDFHDDNIKDIDIICKTLTK